MMLGPVTYGTLHALFVVVTFFFVRQRLRHKLYSEQIHPPVVAPAGCVFVPVVVVVGGGGGTLYVPLN